MDGWICGVNGRLPTVSSAQALGPLRISPKLFGHDPSSATESARFPSKPEYAAEAIRYTT